MNAATSSPVPLPPHSAATPTPTPTPTTATPPDGLAFDLRRGRHAVELRLRGDLDLVTGPRLLAAVGWLRRRVHSMIVLDTTELAFVDVSGYRAFEASLTRLDGSRDPRVVYVVGDVLAHLQRRLAAATGQGPPRLS